MILIAVFIFAVLAITAVLHVMWAFRITWPAKDKQALVDAALGVEGATNMPVRSLTLTVAAGIGCAAVIALWGADIVRIPLPQWFRTIGLTVLSAIFLLRGVVSYLPIGPATTVQFRTLDQRYYAPLILLIGFGYLALLWLPQ